MSTPVPLLVKSIIRDQSEVRSVLFRSEVPYRRSVIFKEFEYNYIEGNTVQSKRRIKSVRYGYK